MNFAGIVSAGIVVVSATTFAQLCVGWTAVLPIAALAIFGWYYGIFLAVIAGLQILASFIAAFAWAQSVAAYLTTFGMPIGQAIAASYVLIFATSLATIRLAIGAWMPEGAMQFGQLVDGIGGICSGAVAGAILGGALLVGWSLAPLPDGMRFDAAQLPFDGGRHVLWTVARCVSPDIASAHAWFDGGAPAWTSTGTGGIRASEPFVDANGNHLYDAGANDAPDGERFLDLDGNGRFTPDIRWADADGEGRRQIGVHDCYRLADWSRVCCMHAPVLTSGDTAEIREDHAFQQPVYRASAKDADGNDILSYRVRPASNEETIDVEIDPTTDEVTLMSAADFETKKRHDFVVEVRDNAGLTDEKRVTIRVRDVPLH